MASGRVENEVQFLRGALFTLRLGFDHLAALNAWLLFRCADLV